MTNNSRVFHVKRGFSLKFKQVQKAIEQNCSFVWVEYGRTFRDATIEEAAAMRKETADKKEGMGYWIAGKDDEPVFKPYLAELPEVTFKPPIGAELATRLERQRAFEANQFYTLAVQ